VADLTFRWPHQRDVAELAARMRPGDVAELHACDHFDLHAVVRQGVETSRLCWSVLEDGELLCIFGVAPLRPQLLLEHVGVPWFLGTEAVARHRRTLTVAPPAYIARMLEAYPRLLNFVHAENHQAIRWLRRLNFMVSPAEPFGPNGALFHRFEMQRHV
jgi:hypothetical protein